MREGYAKAFGKYLATSREQKEVSRDEVLATIRREMLVGKYTEEEIGRFGDLSKLTTEQFVEVLNRKAVSRQKVVPAGEARALVEEGWEYVAQLPDGSVVMRIPAQRL